DNYTTELGGDWEHRFTPTLSGKVIGLLSEGTLDQINRFETYAAFPTPTTGTRREERSTQNGERILRGQMKWTLSDSHTLEFGAEGAFNYRDTTLDVVRTTNGGPETPVPVLVANALVEETRG